MLAAFSDERLVEQVRRGNDDAFEALYDRHHRGILSFCRHMLASADEAEDAVQQTFISAYDAIRADRRDLRLKAWLYVIARNRCLSILRARREQPAELDDVPTAGLSEEVQQRADLRQLLDDVRDLPVDQRAALVLSELGDLSHAEVGAVVGCEVAKVKSLVFQARSSLIESRKALDIPCHEIREQLATLTGGALRRGPLRRHIRACAGCAEFREDVRRQRRALAAVLPVVPTIGLKSSALAAIGLGGGGGAAMGGGAAAGGGIASLVSSGAANVATVVVVAGVAVGGGLVLHHQSPASVAEAAGGPGSGSQAWPAPPAGGGPGAQAIAWASPSKTGLPGAPVAAQRRHAGSAPSVHRGVRQHARGPDKGGRAPNGHRSGGRQPAVHSQPGPDAPATAPAPATPSAPTTDNREHGHHGGWHQGVGHQHHGQHIGGIPLPGGHSGDSSGHDGEPGGEPHGYGDGHSGDPGPGAVGAVGTLPVVAVAVADPGDGEHPVVGVLTALPPVP